MKKGPIKLSFTFLIILLMGCALKTSSQEAAPKTAQGNENIALILSPAPEKKAWETEWERVLKAAKKEGRVVAYSVRSDELVRDLRAAFFSRYGIQFEHIPGQGPTLHQKIVTEYKAGVTGCDVYLPGTTGLINVLKPAGVVDPIEPELILPDVTDPEEIKKVWFNGKLDWIDKERMGLGFLSRPNAAFVINGDLMSPEELKSYRDILNPKWQGKIIMDDPTQPGSGQKWVGVAGDVIMGWDYIRELVNQKPMLSRDHRVMAEWLARGKYAISIGILTDAIKVFQKAGVPLKLVIPREGTYRTVSGSIIVLPKARPHPAAARVFVNWTLSAEAGAIWQKWYQPSSRLDVSKQDVDPVEIFQAGVQYFNSETEEWAKKAPEHMAKAGEIFAPLLK